MPTTNFVVFVVFVVKLFFDFVVKNDFVVEFVVDFVVKIMLTCKTLFDSCNTQKQQGISAFPN